jgi:hypothetical protein
MLKIGKTIRLKFHFCFLALYNSIQLLYWDLSIRFVPHIQRTLNVGTHFLINNIRFFGIQMLKDVILRWGLNQLESLRDWDWDSSVMPLSARNFWSREYHHAFYWNFWILTGLTCRKKSDAPRGRVETFLKST